MHKSELVAFNSKQTKYKQNKINSLFIHLIILGICDSFMWICHCQKHPTTSTITHQKRIKWPILFQCTLLTSHQTKFVLHPLLSLNNALVPCQYIFLIDFPVARYKQAFIGRTIQQFYLRWSHFVEVVTRVEVAV